MTDRPTISVDFGDGVSALSRTMRTITMIASEAIQTLTGVGWDRDMMSLEIPEDPMPCWLCLCGKRVFIIDLINHDGKIVISGKWLDGIPVPKKKGLIRKILSGLGI